MQPDHDRRPQFGLAVRRALVSHRNRPPARLNDLASLGPFFAVETHVPGQLARPPWQPMTALVDGTAALPARVQAVRTALADGAHRRPPEDIAIRVVASVAHLGLIARLLAPGIGAFTLGHRVVMSPDELWWQDHLGGPYPLSVTAEPAIDAPVPGGAVEAITGAFAQRYGVSERVLWGNVGSAANSAARLISTARPDLTGTAHKAADSILADPRIDGGASRAGPGFRRRSCCLIYRIANDRTAICGDCILG